jgi:serine/threonine protein kinase/HEAT repeat protein
MKKGEIFLSCAVVRAKQWDRACNKSEKLLFGENMEMSGMRICPDCGLDVPAVGLAGLCPACLLRQGAAGDTGGAVAFTPPKLEDLARLFPQWEILELIGRGGMGAVYKVRQRELDRIVALKILPPGLDDRPGFAERFTREAKALAKLNHPGIVTIHDSGRVEGLYYLLMEYVDGLNLRQLLEKGRVSWREALTIVPMICDALQYAHDAGLVHRDIKPENILLDQTGRVKVADFGLAKLVGAEEFPHAASAAGHPFFTEAGQVLGTPQYMAPEQFSQPHEVDHRADIYALGVVLYQMLTGELPGTVWAPPSQKTQGDVRLDEVVQRAMQRKPELRYQQASQVKDSVVTILDQPVSPNSHENMTMDISFQCPSCHQKLSVDATAAGTEVNCPSCTQAMIVPHAAPPPVIQPPAPAWQPQKPAHLPPAGKRAKGWAIWALVLGLIGLIPILGMATGLLGLIFGIVALVKKTTSRGLAIAGTVTGAVAALMIPLHFVMAKGMFGAMKFGADTAVCAQNLTVIGKGISGYQSKHGGAYPPNLEALVQEGFVAQKALQCPLLKDKLGQASYVYARPGGTQANGIIVWPRESFGIAGQAAVGRNVLDADLSVRFVSEQDFRRLPKATSQVVASRPQPSTSPRPSAGPTHQRPGAVPPKPVEEPLSLERALEKMKSAKPDEMRPLLQAMVQGEVEPARTAEVIATVKPLLNDVEHGAAAFAIFAKWADNSHVPEFIEMLKVSPNSARGKECMKLLSRMGDERAAQPLAECLKEFHIARDAQAALVALGPIAKPGVLPYYFHDDRRVRDTARELLRGYGITDAEIFAESMKALQADSVNSRWAAVEHLSAMKLTDAAKPGVAMGLRPLIEDDDLRLRDFARNTMKKVVTKADAEFLLQHISSDDEKTRRFAVEMLVELKDVRVAKPLAAQLPDPQETYRAGNSLIQLGSIAESEVIPYLRSEDAQTVRRAADVLAKIGTNASLSALQAAARSKDFFSKAAAESAIGAIKGRAAGGNNKR